MTLKTPDTQITLDESLIGSLAEVIADLRQQIEAIKQEAATGGKLDIKTTQTMFADLNRVVVACTSMEVKLDDYRNKKAGVGRGGYALDMAQARADIGCKLDRLRACCGAGPVSE